jgi:hypothetical protein
VTLTEQPSIWDAPPLGFRHVRTFGIAPPITRTAGEGTQVARLLSYLRGHPGASSLDIIRDVRIVNTTGRISDIRALGHTVEAVRVEGIFRYWLGGRHHG